MIAANAADRPGAALATGRFTRLGPVRHDTGKLHRLATGSRGARACPLAVLGQTGQGFSLVELLLALTLGLMVIAAMAQLFGFNRQSHAMLERTARAQQSGRYALAFIGRSARNAGFLGCNGRQGNIVNALDSDPQARFEADASRPVDAFDGHDGGSAAAHAIAAGIDPDRIVPGTDIVTFRRLQSPLYRVLEPVEADGNPVVERGAGFDLQADDYVLIGDCEQASVFRIAGVLDSGGKVTLLREPGADIQEDSSANLLSAAGKAYGLTHGATVGRVLTETYFIARGRGVDRRGEPTRSLWRRDGGGTVAELVEGVHDLQVSFGVDTRPADGVVGIDRRVGFDGIPDGGIVAAVYVRVVAGEPPDLRAFGGTFNLRNAS